MILLIEELVLRQLVAFVNVLIVLVVIVNKLIVVVNVKVFIINQCVIISKSKKKVYFAYYNDKHMLVYNVLD
jgi:hypothetical protein